MLRKQWPTALCKEIHLILRSKDQRENYEVRTQFRKKLRFAETFVYSKNY